MKLQYNKDRLLVKIDTAQFKFPEVCPVCGDIAVKHGTIARSLMNKHFSTGEYYASGYLRSRTNSVRTNEIRSLKIPVCDRHHYSIDEMSRVRSIMTFVGGITVALALSLGVVIAFLLYDAYSIPLDLQILLSSSLCIAAVCLYGLGPSKLEQAVNIVDFDNNDQTIVLQIQNRWYADEILSKNISSAQIVRYTLKPRF